VSGAGGLRIAVIAPLRFPIRPPHSGGLESAVWSEVTALRARGHEVTMVAVRGSDFVIPDSPFELPILDWPRGAALSDMTYPLSYEATTVPALERALEALALGAESFDVVSNHCLHPLPLRWAAKLGTPMVTTLHTPPDAAFIAAHATAGPGGSTFLSVSDFTRREWARAGLHSDVLPNGVDPHAWPEGRGGEGIVWFGRIVPEKAPHLAVDVARRLGRPLTIAGRIGDRAYAEHVLLPLIGDDVTVTGPLAPARLAAVVGGGAAALSTPAWAEPFGLVAPEALMCGTPVVSFAVGGVPEIAAGSTGMEIVGAGDVDAMAERAERLIERTAEDASFRRRIRASALRRFSLERRIGVLEDVLTELAAGTPLAEGLTA
jgi:glycosyltransferase involved in cell wall biosynthesis